MDGVYQALVTVRYTFSKYYINGLYSNKIFRPISHFPPDKQGCCVPSTRDSQLYSHEVST